MTWPDFFLLGAPKAGTTALHAALSRHPRLFLSDPKEPKYFLTGGRRPSRAEHRGPGDAHSRREWVWRTEEYLRLFDAAPPGTLRGESTPFYLHDPRAHERIRAAAPHARLVAVLRDPVDRAYSNWMHLRSDGLEPLPDFRAALAAEPGRLRRGYAPMWAYRGLGEYGRQLEHLVSVFPAEQVHVLRYRELVDTPGEALAGVCAFLGVAGAEPPAAPRQNVKPFVPASTRNDALRTLVRAGAWTGQWLPPAVWRRVEGVLLQRLHAGGRVRPALPPDQRAEAVELFRDDVLLLERLTGRSYGDWLSGAGRGSFAERSRGTS